MNNISKYMAAALLMGFAAAACQPDEFDGADQNKLATVEGTDITVTVDQTTNAVSATAPALKGAYHVWNLPSSAASGADGVSTWSTLQTVKRVYVLSGDKKIIYRIGNRNGLSQAAIEKTIHIDNALLDLAGVARVMASDDGREWTVAADVEAHLGYGPKGGDGSGTWTAPEGRQDGLACYDDVITFYSGEQSGKRKSDNEKSGEPRWSGHRRLHDLPRSTDRSLCHGNTPLLRHAP